MTPSQSGRGYLKPLVNHSLLIILFVLIAVTLALVYGLMWGERTPYEAQSVILFKSQASDRLVLTGQDANFQQNTVDPTRLARSVQVLISSHDVADRVRQRANSDSDPKIKSLSTQTDAKLMDAISVDVKTDVITVKAKWPTADTATWLANAWAEEAVTKVNQFYAASSSRVSEAVEQARADLEADQRALEEFVIRSPLNSLEQQLKQSEGFVASATNSFTSTQFLLYDKERQAQQRELGISYTYVYTVEQQLSELQAFRTRVEQSSDDPDSLYANQVALLVSLNKLITSNPGAQVQLQVNLGDVGKTPLTKASQLRDVDSTLAAVQRVRDDLQTRIQDLERKLSVDLPAVTPETIASVPETLRQQIERQNQIQSDIEKTKFQYAQLEKTRDLHQSSYDLLRNRLAEQGVNQVISRVVDVGAPANTEQTLRSRSVVREAATNTAEAALIALVLGVGVAYLLNALRPSFNSNAALRRRFRPDSAGRLARVDSGS